MLQGGWSYCFNSLTPKCYYFSFKYLFVPHEGLLCLASWPGRLDPTPLRCFWSAGLVCKCGSYKSAYLLNTKHIVIIQKIWLHYGVVVVGLGGRFSGEQSSVGEGRPSESSLSRWTWNGQRCSRFIGLFKHCVTIMYKRVHNGAVQHTCLSLAARRSWWLIIALCSRHDSGPSSSRDLGFDLISCFWMKRAIS